MTTSAVFLHLDVSGSGNYSSTDDHDARELSSSLAAWAASVLRDQGARHAAPRGGDAVNAVFEEFRPALQAARAIRSRWRAQATTLKGRTGLSAMPIDWPGFRISITADEADISRSTILDENHHAWEALTSLRGFPRNAIVVRDNVLPSMQPLLDDGFMPILRPINVRHGHSNEDWHFLCDREPTLLGAYSFDGELLTAISEPLLSSHVTIAGNTERSFVTEQGASALRRLYPSWTPDLRRHIVPRAVVASFEAKNRQRELDSKAGVLQETGNVLIRLVADPTGEGEAASLDLQVAPLSWELFSSCAPYPPAGTAESKGRYSPNDSLFGAINEFLRSSPAFHPSNQNAWPTIGPQNTVPLGIEVLVVTDDGFALIRHKDRTTTVSPGQWDVSFSGYARLRPEFGVRPHPDSGTFDVDVATWVAHEFKREVGTDPGNLEGLRLLGLHRNRRTGALDLLGFLPIRATANDLAYALALQRERKQLRSRSRAGEFPEAELDARLKALEDSFARERKLGHSQGVPEREVHRTRNEFIPFTPREFGGFLQARRAAEQARDSYPHWGIMPEAMATILASIAHVHGRSGRDELITSLVAKGERRTEDRSDA